MKIRATLILLLLGISAIGQTWTQVPSGVATQLNSIFLVSHDTIYSVGNSGVGLKTTNGGANWNQLNIGPATQNAIRFINPTIGFMAGDNLGVLKTTDAGNTWTYISSGSPMLYDFYFPTATTGWAVGDLEMGFGALFNPHTTTFIQVNGIAGKVLRGVWFVDSLTGWAVGNVGAIVRTVNGGTTWLPQNSGTSELLSKIMFANSSTGISVGYHGTIIKTTDGGATWTVLNSGTTENLYSVYYADTMNVWVSGDNGIILHSDDGGANWVTENSGTTQSLRSIHGLGTTEVWSCGLGGVVLHRNYIAGVSAIESGSSYRLYPNPAHDQITVEYKESGKHNCEYTIRNTFGQEVYHKIESSNSEFSSAIIDLAFLSQGIYFLEVTLNSQTSMQRIIKY